MPRMSVSRAQFLRTPQGGGVEYPAGYGGPAPEWVVAALEGCGAAVRLPGPDAGQDDAAETLAAAAEAPASSFATVAAPVPANPAKSPPENPVTPRASRRGS